MKKILPLFLMLFWSFNVSAVETPQKFKNPIFNGNLWTTNNNLAHDLRLTPTHIYDFVSEDFDEDCDYVTEDDKAVLLKCKQSRSDDQEKPNYEMFFVRYQWKDRFCEIWACIFDTQDNSEPNLYVYSSKTLCPDDPEYQLHERINKQTCLKELQDRGWNKYISSGEK